MPDRQQWIFAEKCGCLDRPGFASRHASRRAAPRMSADREHDFQTATVRGRVSRQLRCTKCGLWETELSRMKPCGQPWDDFIQGVPDVR